MFSMREKQFIAAELEKILLSLHHPEMPTEKPKFHLRVDGAESWSFAEIDPNWTFEGKEIHGKVWNEIARGVLGDKDTCQAIEHADPDHDHCDSRPKKVRKTNVHTEHCCSQCGYGCKYGNIGCPVVIGAQIQSYPCTGEHW